MGGVLGALIAARLCGIDIDRTTSLGGAGFAAAGALLCFFASSLPLLRQESATYRR